MGFNSAFKGLMLNNFVLQMSLCFETCVINVPDDDTDEPKHVAVFCNIKVTHLLYNPTHALFTF